MNSNMMRSLLWKDAKSLWPLVAAAMVGIIVINAIAAMANLWMHGRLQLEVHVAIWIFVPNLVALGAPALLVGGEEESGTLAWLRTLPVAWQKVVDSKLIVSIAAWLVTWVAATLVLAFFYAISNYRDTAFVNDLTGALGATYMVFFGALLLLYGFVLAYTFRSPVAALVVLLLTAPFVHVLSVVVIAYALVGKETVDHWEIDGISNGRWLLGIGAAIGFLLLMWVIQRLLGRRRMTSPAPRRLIAQKIEQTRSAYRPPSTIGLDRPSMLQALHWQQFRQVGWPVIALTVIGVVAGAFRGIANLDPTILPSVESRHGFFLIIAGLAPLFMVTCCMWLGTLVFYGDSVRRRCGFFADRGVAPSKIWWTRMLLPLLGCALIVFTALFTMQDRNGFPEVHIFVLVNAFALGQLISLWMKRPILSFIATPAYGGICALLYAMFFHQYESHWWTTMLLAPILLFATYRLCSRWLSGKIDFGFHWRVLAYTAAAIIVPMIGVVGYRIATIPALNTAFRAKVQAEIDRRELALGSLSPIERARDRAVVPQDLDTGRWGRASFGRDLTLDFEDRESLMDAVKKELSATDQIGEHIHDSHISAILSLNVELPESESVPTFPGLNEQDVEALKQDAMKIALAWVHRIREATINQSVDLYWYQQSAEKAESTVAHLLSNNAHWFGGDKEIAEIVAMFATSKERNEARRVALLRAWQRFHEDPTKNPGYDRTGIFLISRLHHNEVFGIEGVQSSRHLDKYVELLLNHLDNGFPVDWANDLQQRSMLWTTAHSPKVISYRWNRNVNDPLNTWNRNHEETIESLRRKYPAPAAQPEDAKP